MISVLYVDDDHDLLDIGKLFLERSGELQITTRISAKEGLELLAVQDFDVILSDYQMPLMDGIEFLKTVRERYSRIPFILFTGKGREEVVIQAINNGADYYVQKGGDPTSQFAELGHKIAQAAESRRVAEALKNSEQRMADIINFLPDATFAIDLSGRIIVWNKVIEEITGYSAAEMMGKGDNEYSIPFYGYKRPLLIDLIFSTEDIINGYDYNILRREGNVLIADAFSAMSKGEPKTFYCKASPLYDKNGMIVGAIESIRDVTEARNAENELRTAYEQITASEEELRHQYDELAENQNNLKAAYEKITAQDERLQQNNAELNRKEIELKDSARQFRLLIEHSPLPIAVYENDGSLSMLNARFTDSFGYDAGDIRNLENWWLLAYPDPEYRANVIRNWNRVRDKAKAENSAMTSHEYSVRIKDGSIKQVEIFGSWVGNKYLAIFNDITSRKQAQDELARSEEMFRSFVEKAPVAMYIESNGRFSFLNAAAARLMGFDSPQKLIGTSTSDRIRSVIISGHRNGGRGSDDVENICIRKDGSTINVDISAAPIRFQDNRWTMVILHDVSDNVREVKELHETEQDLRKRLDTVLSSDVQLEEIQLESIIDKESVQTLADSINRATDMSIGIMDLQGNVLVGKGWQEMCTMFHWKGGTSRKECIDSLLHMTSGLKKGEYRQQKCSNHMWDVVTPIIVEGRTVGYIILGQFFYEDDVPDRSFFVGQAERFGYDPEKYLEAMEKIPKLSRKKVQDIMPFYAEFADIIAQLSHNNLKLARAVSERDRMEMALSLSEEQYSRLVRNTFDTVIVHQGGCVIQANEAAAELFRVRSTEDLVGRMILDYVAPEYREMERGRIERLYSSSGAVVPKAEVRFIRSDGTPVDVEVSATSFMMDGKPTVQAVLRDLTAINVMPAGTSVRMESTLRSFIDASSEGLAIIDQHGNVIAWNSAFADLTGVRMEQALGRPFQDLHRTFIAPQKGAMDTMEMVGSELRSALESGTSRMFGRPLELSLSRPDGVRRNVRLVMFPFRTTRGNCIGVIAKDVTDRVQAEAVLQEKEEQYRLILQNVNDGIIINELTMDGPGRFIDANLQACRILGYTKKELKSIKMTDIVNQDMRLKAPSLMAELGRKGSVLVQFDYLCRDGKIKTLESNTAVLELKGKRVMLSVIRDVTQRKEHDDRVSRVYQAFLKFGIDPVPNIQSMTALAGEVLEGSVAMFYLMDDGKTRAIGKWRIPEDFILENETEGCICYDMLKKDSEGPIILRSLCSSAYARSDPSVIRYGIDTFIGTSVSIGGRPLGLLAIGYLSDHEPTELDLEILGLLSKAIGIEMERYQAILAVNESQSHYRAIIEHMQEVYLRTEMGKIVSISPSGAKVFGYNDAGEMIGMGIIDFYLDAKDRDQMLTEISRTGVLNNYILRMRRRDGTPFDVSMNAQFYRDNTGSPIGIEGFVYDVTEIKHAQEVLAQTNKKLNLLSTITRHDVLNKLTVLRSYLSLVELDGMDATMQSYLAKAKSTAEAIKDQIEFTRIYQDLGVKSPIWQRVDTMIVPVDGQKVRLDLDLEGLEIFADPLLEKVFYNLMDNSARHGVRVTEIKVYTKRTDEGLNIIWEDNGVGIPRDQKERIFQRGFGKNTGLGLFLVREILAITSIGIHEVGDQSVGARFEMTVPNGAFRFV